MRQWRVSKDWLSTTVLTRSSALLLLRCGCSNISSGASSPPDPLWILIDLSKEEQTVFVVSSSSSSQGQPWCNILNSCHRHPMHTCKAIPRRKRGRSCSSSCLWLFSAKFTAFSPPPQENMLSIALKKYPPFCFTGISDYDLREIKRFCLAAARAASFVVEGSTWKNIRREK